MKFHGNSKKNLRKNHLYEMIDKEKDDVFKYGISCDPIDEDGLSDRIRSQLNLYNLIAGWKRFFARIILKNIEGREKALKIEGEYIEAYRKEHGHKPRGNRK